jgi:predicted transcriptional regulator
MSEDKSRDIEKILRERLIFYRLMGEGSSIESTPQGIYFHNETVKLLIKIIEDLKRIERKVDEILSRMQQMQRDN